MPQELINTRVSGGIATQSRATLPDGRGLPPEIDYDPTSQTFTLRDLERLPLPMDVKLSMPTRSGGQASFVLTIGRP